MYHLSLSPAAVVSVFLWSTYASYWSDCCSPQQSQSPHRKPEEEGRESGKTDERQGGKIRKKQGGGVEERNDGEWQNGREWREEEERRKPVGGRGVIERYGVGGGVGGEAGRERGRSYECWPLSLYINLHINCIKWGSLCFRISSSLTIRFFFLFVWFFPLPYTRRTHTEKTHNHNPPQSPSHIRLGDVINNVHPDQGTLLGHRS